MDRSRGLGALLSAKMSSSDRGGLLRSSGGGALLLVEGLGGTFSGRRGGGLLPFGCDGGSSVKFSYSEVAR